MSAHYIVDGRRAVRQNLIGRWVTLQRQRQTSAIFGERDILPQNIGKAPYRVYRNVDVAVQERNDGVVKEPIASAKSENILLSEIRGNYPHQL